MLTFLRAADCQATRMWADELRVSSTTVSLNFCSPLVFVLLSDLFQQKTQSMDLHVPSPQPHLSDALWWWKVFHQFFLLSLSLCRFLFLHPHSILLSPVSDYQTFLISSSFSLPHTLSLLSLSLCGRVVINPNFIAGEFLSHCRADSSPRSKTLLGPNPILPPSISPSLPPSGPDYWDSGGRKGGGGVGERHHTITPSERKGGKGGMVRMVDAHVDMEETEDEEEEEHKREKRRE